MLKDQKHNKPTPEDWKKDRIKEIMGQIEHGIQDVFQSGKGCTAVFWVSRWYAQCPIALM